MNYLVWLAQTKKGAVFVDFEVGYFPDKAKRKGTAQLTSID